MSLLMEALKKSERAKQKQDDQSGTTLEMQAPAAQPPASTEMKNETPVNSDNTREIPKLALMSNPTQDDRPLRIEPEFAPVMEPSATSPDDDLKIWVQADSASRPETFKTYPDTPRPAEKPQQKPRIPDQDEAKIAATRQKARSVFITKQPANHRKLVITIAVAVIALVVTIYGIYVWQSISGNTPTQPNNLPSKTIMPVTALPPPPAPEIVLSSDEKPRPAAPNLSPAPEKRDTALVPPQSKATAIKRPRKERPESETLSGNKSIRIRQDKTTNEINPILDKAYRSFLASNLEMAHLQYSQALQQEPNNRDALLGLAATALARKQTEQAITYYLRLLELAPTDPEAFAGLIGLRGQNDPAQSESSLKKIMAQNPQSAAVHFALGNVYTQQSRWAEAQQSYFRAYSNAPHNADYAFNLAISLDHLNQTQLAMDYYHRALSLSGPANFDKAAAQKRAQELTPK